MNLLKKLSIFFICLSAHTLQAQLHTAPKDSTLIAQHIAEQTIAAMGGEANFENTNYICWNFFGYRKLIWDKAHDRVRIDYIEKKLTIITSLHSDETILFMNGIQVTEPDSLIKYGFKGKKIWANDSYWLVMPFKLTDKGANLKYLKDSTVNTNEVSILEMTFSHVGFTPDNKYWIYITKKTNLVCQWDYYAMYTDTQPEFSNTWSDYEKYDSILLSSNRGSEGKLTDIRVWQSLPDEVFTQLTLPDSVK